MGQFDSNCVFILVMCVNFDSLYLLMFKLYWCNLVEWKKIVVICEEVEKKVKLVIEQCQVWFELQGKCDIQVMMLVLLLEFKGDWVVVFIDVIVDMIIVVYGNKIEFFLVDGFDVQYFYNVVCNVEIVVWIFFSCKNVNGVFLLLFDEIGSEVCNLSFEWEFGKIVGCFDLMVEFMIECYCCVGISYVQNLLGGLFLQFFLVC